MRTIVCEIRESFGEKVDKTVLHEFNTDAELNVGDILNFYDIRLIMEVTKIFEQCYKYVDLKTGELSNELISSMQREIYTIIIKKENIYGTSNQQRIIDIP